MKSIHFIKLLFVSVFIVTLPLCSYANLTGEKEAAKENFKKKINDFNNSPASRGYNLIKTNTIGGLKCEHYEFNGHKLRIFYNSKGDYITGNEDIDEFDVEPEDMNTFIFSNGMFRLHVKDGAIEAKNDLGLIKLSHTNGNTLYCLSPSSFVKNINWQDFKSGKVINTRMVNIIDELSDNRKDYGWDKKYNTDYYKPKKESALILATSRKDTLFFSQYKSEKLGNLFNFKAIAINKKLYSVNKEDLRLRLIAKKFEGDYVPCLDSDSIVSIIVNEESCRYKINFANGDYILCDNNGRNGGSLHRGGDVMSYFGSTINGTLKSSDGSVFRGELRSNLGRTDYEGSEVVYIEKWLPSTGTKRYPDGRTEEFHGGENEAQTKARIDSINSMKKKKEAEEKATYDSLCKQYGKRFVDEAKKGNIIIGMPEKLLINSFDTRLKQTNGNKKCYYVYNIIGKLSKVVWVVNGKVSSITNGSSRKVIVI